MPRAAVPSSLSCRHDHDSDSCLPDSTGRFVYEKASFRPLRRVYLYTWEGRSR